MGVQKPVAAATPLWRFQYTRQPIPVVAPWMVQKRGVELTISNQKEVGRSQGPLRVGSWLFTLDLSNLAFRKRKKVPGILSSIF
jgi:hypothetical protein